MFIASILFRGWNHMLRFAIRYSFNKAAATDGIVAAVERVRSRSGKEWRKEKAMEYIEYIGQSAAVWFSHTGRYRFCYLSFFVFFFFFPFVFYVFLLLLRLFHLLSFFGFFLFVLLLGYSLLRFLFSCWLFFFPIPVCRLFPACAAYTLEWMSLVLRAGI